MMLGQIDTPLTIENTHRNLLDQEGDEFFNPHHRLCCSFFRCYYRYSLNR